MLTCSKCCTEKPNEEFGSKGLWCRACKAAIDKAYAAANKEAIRKRKNEWQRNARLAAREASPKQKSAYLLAKEAGLKTYSSGEPCTKGHIAERYVRNRECVECQRLRCLLYKEQHRKDLLPKKREYAKKQAAENYEHVRAIAKKTYDNRTEEQKKRSSELAKAWRKKNSGRVLAWTRERQLSKSRQTPQWLTDFDKLKIECYYSIAAMLTRVNKEPWHVDHILPLRGKTVSGLHVPSNLRVVPAVENLRKGNRVEADRV